MKTILLLAAIHVLIIYQARKKGQPGITTEPAVVVNASHSDKLMMPNKAARLASVSISQGFTLNPYRFTGY